MSIETSLTETLISGGREETILVSLVKSNYHSSIPGERLINIAGPVSLKTLEEIVSIVKKECKLITLDDGDVAIIV